MDLINDLNNELAVSVLVKKEHTEKIKSQDVPVLVDRLRNALKLMNSVEQIEYQTLAAPKLPNTSA